MFGTGSGARSSTAQEVERAVAAAAPGTARLVAVETVHDWQMPGGPASILVPFQHVEKSTAHGFTATYSYRYIAGAAAAWFDSSTGRVKEVIYSSSRQPASAGSGRYRTGVTNRTGGPPSRCILSQTQRVVYATRTWSSSQRCMPGLLGSEPRLLLQSVVDPLAYPEFVGRTADVNPGLASNLGWSALAASVIDPSALSTPHAIYTLIGKDTVDGQPSFDLRQTIPAVGTQRLLGPTLFDVWINRITYRPVREEWSNTRGAFRTIDIRWLPPNRHQPPTAEPSHPGRVQTVSAVTPPHARWGLPHPKYALGLDPIRLTTRHVLQVNPATPQDGSL
jgi:hypothetical protein